jgi:hypothetical protein
VRTFTIQAHAFRSATWRGVILGAALGLLPIGTYAENPPEAGDASETNARLDALFGAHQPYEQFLHALRRATDGGNWTEVATMIAYPISVTISGKKTKLRSQKVFVALATEIMTPKVIAAIHTQAYSGIFANAEGVMIGDGEVWFSGVCRDSACTNPPIKITSIHP